MKKNLGNTDRIIRVLIAAIVAVLYFTHVIGKVEAIVLGILSLIFVATSLIGFCPLYALFGISTKKKE